MILVFAPSPLCLCVCACGRSIEVIVAARRNIYVLDPNEAWEPVLSEQQMVTYTAMSVSPSGRLLALFGETGKIWVLSTNFEENITTFDTQSKVCITMAHSLTYSLTHARSYEVGRTRNIHERKFVSQTLPHTLNACAHT
jgi:hypothetical protein